MNLDLRAPGIFLWRPFPLAGEEVNIVMSGLVCGWTTVPNRWQFHFLFTCLSSMVHELTLGSLIFFFP